MNTVPQLSASLQTLLTSIADQAAKESGFVQRRSKLSGSLFVQTLVFGFWNNPHASREQLAQIAAHLGLSISPQALDQRLHEQAANCLKRVLEAAVGYHFAASPVAIPLLKRFSAVLIQDSSQIGLPSSLARVWVGAGNQNTGVQGSAQLKLSVRLNLNTGELLGPFLDPGTRSDCKTAIQSAPVPAGALRIADLGYFNLAVLRSIEEQGGFWLSRVHGNRVVMDRSKKRIDLLALLRSQTQTQLDLPILLGAEYQLPCRLLVERVPKQVAEQRRRRLHEEAKRRGRSASALNLALADWTLLISNVPADRMSVPEALVLAKARWQIECLWKLWKSEGQIDEWRSAKGPAILCELYAKLIAMLFQHWMIVSACWHFPDRSFTKASASIRSMVLSLVLAFPSRKQLRSLLQAILSTLQRGCRINKRKADPSTFQRLLAPSDSP